jgi:hypothetical protein
MTEKEHDEINKILCYCLIYVIVMLSVFTLAGIGFIIKLVFFNK